jgi:CYTH domain-containing protein
MSIEREWRFVVLRGPRVARARGRRIEQGYLVLDEKLTLRVRITSGRAAAIAIKVDIADPHRVGTGRAGPKARAEYEYDVPLADALDLMRAAKGRLVKRRHRFGRVELDVYEGALRGLVVAEVEVGGRSRKPPEPPLGWEWRDVSGDARYANARLARHGMPRGAPRARLDVGVRSG